MGLFWLGVIVTIGSIYLAVCITIFALAYHEYSPRGVYSVHPREWYRKWWGRPIAAALDALLWPGTLVKIIKHG